MNELRWLEVPQGGACVLQYRQKLTRLDSDGHAVGAMWSEWRDVPTESQMTVSEPPRAGNETQEAK